MIDAVQLPILLKAIDFVFEEGRKILEERRERRKANDALPKAGSQEPAAEIAPPSAPIVVEAKEVQRKETDKQTLQQVA